MVSGAEGVRAARRHRVDARCAQTDATGRVTADLIDRQDDFAEAIAGYTRVGTPGFRPSRLERIHTPEWVDLRDEPGVQAAAMVAYILLGTGK